MTGAKANLSSNKRSELFTRSWEKVGDFSKRVEVDRFLWEARGTTAFLTYLSFACQGVRMTVEFEEKPLRDDPKRLPDYKVELVILSLCDRRMGDKSVGVDRKDTNNKRRI